LAPILALSQLARCHVAGDAVRDAMERIRAYALLLIQPILGLLQTNAHGDRVNVLFLGRLPALIGQDRPLAKQLLKVHEKVGLLLFGLIALHPLAPLRHHFWRRDDTLETCCRKE
jgi:cytochrome b561